MTLLCKKSRSPAAGFSLMELLVVMMIVGLVASLSVPRLFGSYEQLKALAEDQRLADLVESVRLHAFFRQKAYNVVFSQNQMVIEDADIVESFQYLYFPETQLYVDANGFPDKDRIEYANQGKQMALDVWHP